MASFFGEVLGLSSRAVDDGDFEESRKTELVFNVTDTGRKLSCDFIVFAYGRLASAFVESYFLSEDTEVAATASLSCSYDKIENFSGLDYRKKPKDILHAFVNSKNQQLLICEVEEMLPEELNVELCQKILSLCSDNVESLTLMSCHSTTHKSDSCNVQEAFLRCLLTSRFIEKYSLIGIPYLKPPNIITDFPAAVLTEFQVHNRAAALIVCYTDVLSLDSKTVGLFNPVLSIPLVQQKLPLNENPTDRLREYFKTNYKQADNLYM